VAQERLVRGYWVEEPGRGALRAMPLPIPELGQCELQALWSGISPGTERLVGLGRVPEECREPMACRGMQGSFALPLLYGYSLVGRIVAGEHAGRTAFTMHPHQERVVVPREHIVLLPETLPSARATLFPNLETAWNAVHDAEVVPGERIAVVGGGAVGLLVTFALQSLLGVHAILVEADAERRQRAASLPWSPRVVAPETLARNAFDCVFHATGRSEGLQLAIDALAFEGRVVELSWYGTTPVTVRLGGRFHYHRQRILASQVGTVARSQRAGGYAQRAADVVRLLGDPRLDALLDPPIPFADLPAFFQRLYRGEVTSLCPLVSYPTV
jgi:2-desacetyl-2-hydroxyethyl bacteriochlorophyllide A dehydrogenase